MNRCPAEDEKRVVVFDYPDKEIWLPRDPEKILEREMFFTTQKILGPVGLPLL